jgi:hypothetical protein
MGGHRRQDARGLPLESYGGETSKKEWGKNTSADIIKRLLERKLVCFEMGMGTHDLMWKFYSVARCGV